MDPFYPPMETTTNKKEGQMVTSPKPKASSMVHVSTTTQKVASSGPVTVPAESSTMTNEVILGVMSIALLAVVAILVVTIVLYMRLRTKLNRARSELLLHDIHIIWS